MADLSLTDLERRVRIQQLMDGSSRQDDTTSSISSSNNDATTGTSATDDGLQMLPPPPRRMMMMMDTATSSLSGMTIGNNDTDVRRNDDGNSSATREGRMKDDGKVGDDDDDEGAAPCIHYENNCDIISPCCNRIFGCRVCHDDCISNMSMMSTSTTTTATTTPTTTCGIRTMDRFAITQIVCRNCRTKQSSNTNNCIVCNIRLSEYHCNICNIWMTNTASPFHCGKCGFCRVGGRTNYRHCDTCCMCLSISIYNEHDCKPDKYKSNCPVCHEDMFISRRPPVELPCGHAIHVHCFRSMTSYGNSRCPICKKTVVNREDMILAWTSRARDVEAQPMPNDLARVVDILCNDCEVRSGNRDWHFLGVQCLVCLSFNTVVEGVVSTTAAPATTTPTTTTTNNMGNAPAGGEGL